MAGGKAFLRRPRDPADDGASISRLWVTDGTVAGSRDLGTPDVRHDSLVAAGDAVSFCAGSYDAGSLIWRSDGTPEGTAPAFARPVECVGELAVSAGRLFFSGDTGRHGVELWSGARGPAMTSCRLRAAGGAASCG